VRDVLSAVVAVGLVGLVVFPLNFINAMLFPVKFYYIYLFEKEASIESNICEILFSALCVR
jgi:hypothetical protein